MGNVNLNGLSNQFIGYAAHYIYAYCNNEHEKYKHSRYR